MCRYFVLAVLAIAICSEAFAVKEEPPAKGTINVILANANGIVAITDSRLTQIVRLQPLQVRQSSGQKLFQLDDATVCTFAGFAAAPISAFPELTSNTAGILQDLRRQLVHHPVPGFEAKLHLLSFIFQSRLAAIANIRDIASETEDYRIEITLAGLDIDGTPKIGQITLTLTRISRNGTLFFEPHEADIHARTVGRDLIWELAGIVDVAKQVLENHQYSQDPPIADFVRAYAANRASDFTVDQMKHLAIALAPHTAENNQFVGGDDQIAIIDRKRISLQQAAFPEQPPAIHYALFEGGTFRRSGTVFSGPGYLVFKSTFQEIRQQVLDGNFFFDNDFSDSEIVYDGGFTKFDSSNRVRNCTLLLGAHAEHDSATVRHLLDDFRWKDVKRVQAE